MSYVAIDIGGTKTLVCTLSDTGIIESSHKFPTPKKYSEFIALLQSALKEMHADTQDYRAGSIAAPGRIDRKKNIIQRCGNLNWENIDILRDVEPLVGCPLRLENDAKLGALSEYMLVRGQFSTVLYITVSTGIGIGLVEDGRINTAIGDGGGRTMLLPYRGKLTPWEDFASGSAIVGKYGKMAGEITDRDTWKAIVHNLTPGFLELTALLSPEVIIIGGGAGRHLAAYKDILEEELSQYETPLLRIPAIQPAQRPDEAVIYGCYDYARQQYV